MSRGMEITGCAGTEIKLFDCQSSEETCRKWGQEKICSDISYCNPSSSCSNYTILQGLNCICYEGKVHVIS